MNLIIMPYTYQIDSYIDVLVKNKLDKLVGIIADTAYIDALQNDWRVIKNDIKISNDLNDLLCEADKLMIFESCIKSIGDDRWNQQVNIAKEANIKLEYIDENCVNEDNYDFDRCNVPIVTIWHTREQINTLPFIYDIFQKAKSDGLNVETITSNSFGRILGYHNIMEVFSENKGLRSNLIRINKFVKHIETAYKPDFIIIDIPFTKNNEFVYLVQSTLQCDFNIVITEAFKCFDNYYRIYEKSLRDNYIGNIDLIVMSDVMVDFISENEGYPKRVSQKSLSKLAGCQTTVYDTDKIYEKIVTKFTTIEVI